MAFVRLTGDHGADAWVDSSKVFAVLTNKDIGGSTVLSVTGDAYFSVKMKPEDVCRLLIEAGRIEAANDGDMIRVDDPSRHLC